MANARLMTNSLRFDRRIAESPCCYECPNEEDVFRRCCRASSICKNLVTYNKWNCFTSVSFDKRIELMSLIQNATCGPGEMELLGLDLVMAGFGWFK
ncbi:hypothetical protein OIU76_024561 [Salix suchowensis]|nr:hypothetical protein OIU76_024561 [Salix suchowensis]